MNQNFLGWRASENYANNYVNSIKKFLSSDNEFNNFRQPNYGYNTILEHVDKEQGEKYLQVIKKFPESFLTKLNDFKKNDSIGNPLIYEYENSERFNPTTLRYIKFAGDINNHFKDLNDYNLIEIGGGYGGLVRILTELYNFKNITMVDLQEPLNLQEKYLNKFNIKINKKIINDDFIIEPKTLVISNYAWCECDEQTRKIYFDKIISKSKYAFMAIHDVDVNILINEIKKEDSKAEFFIDCIHNTPIYIKK